MPDYSDVTKTETADVAPVAIAADFVSNLFEAPFDLKITAVSYTANAAVTGHATERRTLSVLNRGAAGVGTTEMAALDLLGGVNLVSGDEKALTISATPANLLAVAGDIIAFKSLHIGSTGLADPGGIVQVSYVRALA